MIYNDRTPFVLKSMGDPSLIEGEMFINPTTNLIQIFKDDGNHVSLSYKRLYQTIINKVSRYVGGLTADEIADLIYESNSLYKWMNDNIGSEVETPESNIIEILEVFDGFDKNDRLINMVSNMIDKDENKTLVSNSLSLDDILKINSIMPDANFYAHPNTLQCDLGDTVESVIVGDEVRTGHVRIDKHDIGYGNVEFGANKYEHPIKQQCTAGVVSINGEKGYVELDKRSFGIHNLHNVPPASYNDYKDVSDESMFMSNTAIEYMENRLADMYSHHNKSFYDRFIGKYDIIFKCDDKSYIRTVNIAGAVINQDDLIENDDGSYQCAVIGYHPNVTLSITNRRRENVLITHLSAYERNLVKKFIIEYDTKNNSIKTHIK